jgi:hypothetical protein
MACPAKNDPFATGTAREYFSMMEVVFISPIFFPKMSNDLPALQVIDSPRAKTVNN